MLTSLPLHYFPQLSALTAFNPLRFLHIGQCPLCLESAPAGLFCAICRQDILSQADYAYRCSHCLLALNPQQRCPNCYEHKLILNTIYAAFDYIPPLDTLIWQFKNTYQPYLARAFSDILAQHFFNKNTLKNTENAPVHTTSSDYLIIPIPSSEKSLKKRGFNPASLLAKSLAKQLNFPIHFNLLYRHSSNKMQKSLSRFDRFAESSHLYYCIKRLPQANIILVDDILTTGSTLNAAAQALLAAGAKTVDGMVIARTAIPLKD